MTIFHPFIIEENGRVTFALKRVDSLKRCRVEGDEGFRLNLQKVSVNQTKEKKVKQLTVETGNVVTVLFYNNAAR